MVRAIFDLYFWQGSETTQDEARTAVYKTKLKPVHHGFVCEVLAVEILLIWVDFDSLNRFVGHTREFKGVAVANGVHVPQASNPTIVMENLIC